MNIFPKDKNSPIVVTTVLSNGANVMLKRAMQCGCGIMTMLVFNRMGKSYCSSCVPRELVDAK